MRDSHVVGATRSVHRRKIPVACIQTSAHDRDGFTAAWPSILADTERAAAAGARLIVLPEATVPGYVLGTRQVAADVLDGAARDLALIAERYEATIVYGSAKYAGGLTYNAAVAIGPDGTELGYAAKQFLWHFDRLWFAPGTTLQPIDTPIGKLGLLVCADGRIPTIAATLVERGAEILVMPTAWVTSGRDPQQLENVQADLMVNIRARENGVAFVAANKSGVELGSVAYCGKSTLVRATGETAARAGQHGPEILVGEVEIGSSVAAPVEPFVPSGAHEPAERRTRARIAIVAGANPENLGTFAALARQADADVVLTVADAATSGSGRVFPAQGIRCAAVAAETLASPRGLVAARLAGIDLFTSRLTGDEAWHVPLARTRASELRAYVVVFAGGDRVFAVDPDGVVLAGTFGDYRVAAFSYDAARAAATEVAPSTDVLHGLRTAETMRAQSFIAKSHF